MTTKRTTNGAYVHMEHIGETLNTVEVQWNEQNKSKSIPLKHIKDNVDNTFSWPVLANTPKNTLLETYYIDL